MIDYKYFDEFMELLKKEQKDQAVIYAIDLLDQKKLSIEALYLELLAPSLIFYECNDVEEICIWKEHLRTSIIRTILEISYLYIIERSKTIPKTNIKIVVLTPAFEYHEIGAIMNANLMILLGLDATYIGANTPKDEILSAIRTYKPDYIALSVTNPYNLVITKQITEEIKRFFPEVGIVLGGQAFKNMAPNQTLHAHYVLNSLDDLKRFRDEVSK